MKNVLKQINTVNDGLCSVPLGDVNGNTVFLRVMNNYKVPFHQHCETDELFFVLSGILNLDVEATTKTLEQGQAYTVKAGLKHRARVVGRAEIIVVRGIVE